MGYTFNSNKKNDRLVEKINNYILSLENDARIQENIGDFEAAYLIKDIKADLEQIMEEGR